MKHKQARRTFLKYLGVFGGATLNSGFRNIPQDGYRLVAESESGLADPVVDAYTYTQNQHARVAIPIGGIGAGMFCLEGTGAVSHMSIRHAPDLFFEPAVFAAIAIKGCENGTRVLEGGVPSWKKFGQEKSVTGKHPTTWGMPRFDQVTFKNRFPYGEIALKDADLPVQVKIKGWSPFIPGDDQNSSLPVGVLTYTFKNTSKIVQEMLFSYNANHFLKVGKDKENSIISTQNGFILKADPTHPNRLEERAEFAIYSDQPDTIIDHCWFRGGWFDGQTIAWKALDQLKPRAIPPVEGFAPGASLYVPFTLQSGEEKTVTLNLCWYVPKSSYKYGKFFDQTHKGVTAYDLGLEKETTATETYRPFYASLFSSIQELIAYWDTHGKGIEEKTAAFAESFYNSSLAPSLVDTISRNLSILKTPTVFRQYDGRFWAFEGCGDKEGSCHGSCTHVWNYAQALPHLFPRLERSLRYTEFCENQMDDGFQSFRANLPISPVKPTFHAAADGQLGGIMKVYRDWRISGDDDWLKTLFPRIKKSLDYCIETWDPKHDGILVEPHHNTYDIEFWGPDSMCSSFYLGALVAFCKISRALNEPNTFYQALYEKGRVYMEQQLFNGTYFYQKVQWKGLRSKDPSQIPSMLGEYSTEAKEMLVKEGPKYQYAQGCLSDGVIGAWMARVCGLGDILDPAKVVSHLKAVHRYNFKPNLSLHVNLQRTTYAMGNEPGLILCSWPKGDAPSLPFVYSDEVWTGIEYQVASHLIMMGETAKGMEIVNGVRKRYDGSVRNPYNEYEFGAWYARALSSYSLIQAATGIFYDAVEKTLSIQKGQTDFTSFIATANGFGNVIVRGGKVEVKAVVGEIPIKEILFV